MPVEQPEPPPAAVASVINGAVMSRAVYAVVVLGVPDLLAAGPRRSADLAAALDVRPRQLHQILRAVATTDLLRTEPDGSFALTDVGRFLCVGHPSASRDIVLLVGIPAMHGGFGEILTSLRTGRPGFDIFTGEPVFDYLAGHPDEAAVFHRAIVAGHAAEPLAVAAAYDFSGVGHVVDVGGGIGRMLAAVLSAAPEPTTGTLFDLPHVVAQARESLAASPIAKRFSYAEGSFFDGVPAGGDAYILSHILHDWSDEKCVTVLEHCRQALKPDGRILVVEVVLPDGDEPHPMKSADVAMAIIFGGSERTETEYDALFAAAGLRLTGITPTSSMVSVMEARAA